MILELDSHSPDRTFDIGAGLGKSLRGDEVILISGDLGAGKTLLTKGIADSLGIDPTDIVSPTFTLMNRYLGELYLENGASSSVTDVYLFHFDLYRLGEMKGRFMPELDESIDEGIVVVEWAQFLAPQYFQPPNVIDIKIATSPHQLDWRSIRIESKLEYLDI